MQEPNTLRSLFHAELEAQALENTWGMKERVRWVLDHLDEYIERWLGFATPPFSPTALIESDLFTVVDIAVESLEQEFACTASSVEDRQVKHIRDAVEALRMQGDRKYAIALKERVDELRSSSSIAPNGY